MRLAILCQEEPVFLGPFLQGVIRQRPKSVVAVLIAGRRSAGESHRTRSQAWRSLWTLWLILEPRGFLISLGRRLRQRLFGDRDRYSIARVASEHGIPVYRIDSPNSPETHALLRQLAVDAVLNQSECLLKREVLAIPRRGFVNRHASLLPRFRGRMGAFYAHAAEPPSYGLTIHLVDEGIDTGGIIHQVAFDDVNSAWPYYRVMRHLMANAPCHFWTAMDMLTAPGFQPRENIPVDKPNRFPDLAVVHRYRQSLAKRR